MIEVQSDLLTLKNKDGVKAFNIKKNNILDVGIKSLLIQKENILNVTIANLQRDKNNLKNETIRKLENQRNIVLKARITKLKEEMETLKFNISKENLQNAEVVGGYIVYKNPLKPRKHLIIFLSFMMGLALSVFVVLLPEFVRHQKLQTDYL